MGRRTRARCRVCDVAPLGEHLRARLHGRAAAYATGENVYIRDFGRVRRVKVQGVGRNKLLIEGSWRSVDDVYATAREAGRAT